MLLKFASYNIHACIGNDALFDPKRIVKVIDELDVDVIALQEVEHHLVNNIDFLKFLSIETGMFCISGPTMLRETRHYGNVILSKYPIKDFKRIDLSLKPYEPRGAIHLRIKINGRNIIVVATHLGLKTIERQFQINKLMSQLEFSNAECTVLMGDFNEWWPWNSRLNRLCTLFGKVPMKLTFPSLFPILALDRIFVHPKEKLISISTYKSQTSKIASDHLPLLATIKL